MKTVLAVVMCLGLLASPLVGAIAASGPASMVASGVPTGSDPRFGPISSQPSFTLPRPTHPAYSTRPIIVQPGAISPTAGQPIVVQPGASQPAYVPWTSTLCVPGQWQWWGSHWAWMPAHCYR